MRQDVVWAVDDEDSRHMRKEAEKHRKENEKSEKKKAKEDLYRQEEEMMMGFGSQSDS